MNELDSQIDTITLNNAWRVMGHKLPYGSTHRFIAEAVIWLGVHANVDVEFDGCLGWIVESHPSEKVTSVSERLDVALAQCVLDVADALAKVPVPE